MSGRAGAQRARLERVLGMIEAAARAAARCPTNEEICAALGWASVGQASMAVSALERAGLIRVERFSKARIVTVCSSGLSTARHSPAAPRSLRARIDTFAARLAEGEGVEEAAAAMGVSAATGWSLLARIRKELGEQAR